MLLAFQAELCFVHAENSYSYSYLPKIGVEFDGGKNSNEDTIEERLHKVFEMIDEEPLEEMDILLQDDDPDSKGPFVEELEEMKIIEASCEGDQATQQTDGKA